MRSLIYILVFLISFNMISCAEADAKDTTESDEAKQKEDIKKIVNFTIDNFKLPYKVRAEDINFFLSKKSENASYAHMYM